MPRTQGTELRTRIERLEAAVDRQSARIDSLERQARALFAELGDVTEGQHDRDAVIERALHRLERLDQALQALGCEPSCGPPRRRRRPPLPARLQRELELA